MKTKLTLLVILSILLVSLTISVQAVEDVDIYGGAAFTTLELDKWNDSIDTLNDLYSNNFGASNVEEFNNLNYALAYFAGIEKPINSRTKIGGKFEYIPGQIEASIYHPLQDKTYEKVIKVKIYGYLATLKYNLAQNLDLVSEIGIYNGTKIHEGESISEGDPLVDEEIDIDGKSLKIGLNYSKQWKKDLTFNSSIAYRLMKIEDVDPEENSREQDNNGFELSGSFSYLF